MNMKDVDIVLMAEANKLKIYRENIEQCVEGSEMYWYWMGVVEALENVLMKVERYPGNPMTGHPPRWRT